MQITIADSVFSTHRPHEIYNSISRAQNSRHTISPEDWNGPGFAGWVQACRDLLGEPDIVELLKMSMNIGILVESVRSIKVVLDNDKDHSKSRVSFAELANYVLHVSTYVYVENSRADRAFLLSLIFDERIKKDLLRAEQAGALSFDNCGGITVLSNRIEDDAERRPLMALRSIAIFDSDASGPKDEDISSDVKSAVWTCKKHKVRHLRLNRRAIENYMPYASLDDFADEATGERRVRRAQMARSIRTLTRDQHAYLHMKDGLSPAMAATALYLGLSSEHKQRLAHGFGPDLANGFSNASYVTESRFHASGLTQEIEEIAKFLLEYL